MYLNNATMKDSNLLTFGGKDYSFVLDYGLKLLIALVILIVGLWIINKLSKTTKRVMTSRNVDQTLIPFLVNLLSITLKVLLGISLISFVGVPMTSFIALLGAAGLAVGMALSGTLQNFAGGVILLILKPFKVGDYIEAQGYAGSVNEIQIFNTILSTPDNKKVIIPNGGLATGAMINYSAQATRRVDLVFGIGYNDDIDKAKSIITQVVSKHEKVLSDPALFIGVVELGESSVNLVTRVWVNRADYWEVYFYMLENVKKEFDSQGISIPFPQRDVHLVKEQS
jgi:small conductance mechanosensitive channel